MIIALVGGDGAGKSTLTARLRQRLVEGTRAVHTIERWDILRNPRHPAARFLGTDRVTIHESAVRMPQAARFLFLTWWVGMGVLCAAEAADPADILLVDGYWIKHAASEAAHGLDLDWVSAVGAGMPAPAAVLYLRCAPETAWGRKGEGRDVAPYECGMDAQCRYDQFIDHQRAIQMVLDRWALEQHWQVLDAEVPLHDVERQVIAALDQVLVHPA